MTDPFAPLPPSGAVSGGNITCAQCGAMVPAAEASWSGKGEQICKRCEALETIDEGDTRAAVSILGGGIGALSLGVLSLCINPLLLFSAMAIISGVGTLVVLGRHPEYRQRMAWRYPVAIATSVLGILLALVIPFFLFLGLLGIAMSA
ncbi:MAG: hypothetical protein H6719_03170 [Sandaracinaceae bacterium]|nr:hypothetical protein [Sandaracinaceae bacterium]